MWKKIYLNIVKATCDNPTANITLNDKKKLEVFPLRSEIIQEGFPGDAVDKNPPTNARDSGSILGPGRFHMTWSS